MMTVVKPLIIAVWILASKVLSSCAEGHEELPCTGTFLFKDTLSMKVGDIKEVYKYCDGVVVTAKFTGVPKDSLNNDIYISIESNPHAPDISPEFWLTMNGLWEIDSKDKCTCGKSEPFTRYIKFIDIIRAPLKSDYIAKFVILEE